MKTRYSKLLMLMIFFVLAQHAMAQDNKLRDHYIGFLPAFLAEPYDTIKALEVNVFPFMYEYRMGEQNDLSIQFRPILNYRFYKPEPGISQVGATIMVNKYFLNMFREDYWLKPQLGLYFTYTYNLLDEIKTMTFGIEPGAYMQFSNAFSMSVTLQPGINYYPDEFSQEFVQTESGFKSHFGVLFHMGYNF